VTCGASVTGVTLPERIPLTQALVLSTRLRGVDDSDGGQLGALRELGLAAG
jgi:hypothetical protein